MVSRKCFTKKALLKITQNPQKIPALEFLSNTVKGPQAVRLANALKVH